MLESRDYPIARVEEPCHQAEYRGSNYDCVPIISSNSSDSPVYWYLHARNDDGPDYALTIDGRIALFVDHNVDKVLEPVPRDLCNLEETIQLIQTADSDGNSVILSALNTLLEVADSSRYVLPRRYRTDMERLADHLTFNVPFSDFVVENGVDRDQVVDGILWAVGAVLSSSVFLPIEELAAALSEDCATT